MKIAVCEDNEVLAKNYAEIAGYILSDVGVESTCDIFLSVSEILTSDVEYDLLLLDCELPDGSGIEAAKKLKQAHNELCIIIITAHEQYVYDSFEAEAFRYLLKPLNIEKFEKAIYAFLEKRKAGAFLPTRTPDRQVMYLKISDIMYIEAFGKKSKVKIGDSLTDVFDSISEMDEKLRSFNFMRIHRSYLVNFAYIDKVVHNTAVMKNGDEILVSRRVRREFNQRMNEWLRKGY